MNVLVLHGPTLSFRQDLGEVDRRLAERARALGHVLRTVQTHHEGTLVDALWEQRDWAQGVLLNPGPLALGSHVLREAVAAGKVPVVEVLTVGAKDRAGLAKKSLLREVCAARVSGSGVDAYLAGLERLAALGAGRKSLGRTPVTAGSAARKPVAPPRAMSAEPTGASEPQKAPADRAAPKTLGRRRGTPDPAPGGRPGPSRGRPSGGAPTTESRPPGAHRAAGRASPIASGRVTPGSGHPPGASGWRSSRPRSNPASASCSTRCSRRSSSPSSPGARSARTSWWSG